MGTEIFKIEQEMTRVMTGRAERSSLAALDIFQMSSLDAADTTAEQN